jgi:Recombinase
VPAVAPEVNRVLDPRVASLQSVSDAIQPGVRAAVIKFGAWCYGRHAGGRAFGYRAVPGKPGELEIVEEEAQVVRQIFADYIAGKTPRQIAHDLNERGVRPARGRLWSALTINGNVSRGAA